MSAVLPRWVGEPERGSGALLRFMKRLVLAFGWWPGHLLLYPITAYFLLTAAKSRAASRAFLAAALGRGATLADVFRHHFAFASTILDRAFLLTGRLEGYDIRVSGLDLVKARVEAGQGCVLLGAHLGSFEALSVIADRGCPVRVRTLMYKAHASRANAVFDELNAARAADVIRVGAAESLLRVKEALDAGELVGILGDRIAGGDKVAAVDFMGRRASLPVGPMVVASVLKAPVLLVFAVHRGGRRYDVSFEPFAERVVLDPARRQADLRHWVQRYAAALERMARAYPYNWFNFYDFWDAPDAAAAASSPAADDPGPPRRPRPVVAPRRVGGEHR